MTTIKLEGTFDTRQMMLETIAFSRQEMDRIHDECSFVNPKDINWSNVDRNTWFICLNSTTNQGYYFPICESENRDYNYGRVKKGMKYFISKGWEAYQLQ